MSTTEQLVSDAKTAAFEDLDPERAMSLLDTAFAAATTVEERATVQSTWWEMGRQATTGAIAMFERGLACVTGDPPTLETANMLAAYGELLRRAERFADGERVLRRVIEMHDAAGRDRAAAGIACNLTVLLYKRGTIVEAERVSLDALDRMRTVNDHVNLPNQIYLHAVILKKRGDVTGALAALEEATAACTHADREDVLGNISSVRGSFALIDQSLDEAEAHFVAARAYYERVDHAVGMAVIDGNFAIIARERGDLASCVKRCTEVVATFRRLGESHSVWGYLTERGEAHTEARHFSKATKDLHDCLALIANTEHARDRAYARGALGRLAEAQNNRDEALAHYAEAEIECDEETSAIDARNAIWSCCASAGVRAEMGDVDGATHILERARALEPRIGELGRAATTILYELAAGRIALAAGDRARAALALTAAGLGNPPMGDRCSEVRRVAKRLHQAIARIDHSLR